jgi:hypothetical protein
MAREERQAASEGQQASETKEDSQNIWSIGMIEAGAKQQKEARTPTSCPPEMVLTSARYFFEVEIFLE